MRPTKNHYFCPLCSRTKMLFQTEAKANNFLRYNAEEIFEETGKKPIRAYYCMACCGWHVTSKEHVSGYAKRCESLILNFYAVQRKKNYRRLFEGMESKICSQISKLEKAMKEGRKADNQCMQIWASLQNKYDAFLSKVGDFHDVSMDMIKIRMANIESLMNACIIATQQNYI